jgi:heterodisulfide reductase subunit C
MVKDFGYKINNERYIDYDSNNHSIADFIDLLEPTFKICIACGTCSATCTAAQYTDFSLRKTMLLIRRGENQIANEIDKCMLCGKCTLVCPRGVNTRNIVLSIKKAVSHFNL